MKTIRIVCDVTKSYPLSANLFISSAPPKIKQEQPDQFISALIHEMKNPLTTINLAVQMLPEKYPIHQLLDKALAMTGGRIMLKNILVGKDYTTIDCKVLVDKQKMKIALANIIINAIEAMPSVNGKLILITKSINGKCIIEIKDNGMGLGYQRQCISFCRTMWL
jgi:signal transduction histidine kinase